MKSICTLLFFLSAFVGYSQSWTLQDFFVYDANLEQKVDEIFESMSDTQRVGQMIMPAAGLHGKPDAHIRSLVSKRYVGGILLLNGTKSGFTAFVKEMNELNKSVGGVSLFYSADAEPTLIGYKIKGCAPVKKASQMISREEVQQFALSICKDLTDIGINYNFAPVVDASPNEAITTRSFGDNMDTAKIWSRIFINETQKQRIISTAKHFPGHGFVVGDTHKNLVYIDGEMKEVNNYEPLIDAGVISIMIAHIAIKNNPEFNTDDMPSTTSRKIVTDLLKEKMNFKGIVVTDAMNMGGVVNIPNCELKAAQAGCDIILMPVDEMKALNDILAETNTSLEFKSQIYASVRKIIRLKICLGII